MINLIKEKNKNLKYNIFIATVIHIVIVIFISELYNKKDELIYKEKNFQGLNEKKIFVNAISTNLGTQKSVQSTNLLKQEKINNLKMLEKIPTTSSQKSIQSTNLSKQEKINNLKMLEKIPTISSQKSMQSTNLPKQEKQLLLNTVIKSIKKNNINNQKNTDIIEHNEHNISNLLNQLTNRPNLLKLSNKKIIDKIQKTLSLENNTEKHSKQILDEVEKYKKILIHSINENFYDRSNYIENKCTLHLNLLLDGTLGNIQSSNKNSSLCQAAISAVKLVKLPPPINLEIYEIFKNITLNFSPQNDI